LRKDLIYHFVVSAVLAYFLGFAIALTIGILKEYLWDDKMKKGTPDIYDIYADTVGCWLGVLL